MTIAGDNHFLNLFQHQTRYDIRTEQLKEFSGKNGRHIEMGDQYHINYKPH